MTPSDSRIHENGTGTDRRDRSQSHFHGGTPAEAASGQVDLVTGNYFDKYRSKNPLHRLLVGNFMARTRELLEVAKPESVLEVGCGAGDFAHRLVGGEEGKESRRVDYVGIDISDREIGLARQRYPHLQFRVASANELPMNDSSFDLVLACEVLEHLGNPEGALLEICRVTRGFVLISVPWEPVWRILNVLRGKYLTRLGNTPGHIQHFSRRGIRRLVIRRFEITAERNPFPWTMLLARPVQTATSVSAGSPN